MGEFHRFRSLRGVLGLTIACTRWVLALLVVGKRNEKLD